MTPELKQQRRDFVVSHPCCVCGGLATDCHEILAGANRHASVKERACWLAVCRPCHDEIQGTEPEYQLAYKLLSDPEGFSLLKFCEAWRRPFTAVSAALLVSYVQTILLERR